MVVVSLSWSLPRPELLSEILSSCMDKHISLYTVASENFNQAFLALWQVCDHKPSWDYSWNRTRCCWSCDMSSETGRNPAWPVLGSIQCQAESSGRGKIPHNTASHERWWLCGHPKCQPRPCGGWRGWWFDLMKMKLSINGLTDSFSYSFPLWGNMDTAHMASYVYEQCNVLEQIKEPSAIWTFRANVQDEKQTTDKNYTYY